MLILVARLLARHRLDVVLIGNAAAAIHGSPVTTMELDFMFRKTPTNLTKLKRLADDLDAIVLRPFYPASQLYRVVRARDGLQLDFMAKIDGIRSFESLRGASFAVQSGIMTFGSPPFGTSFGARNARVGNRISPCCPF